MDLLNIAVDDGKYTLVQREDGSGEILRYGEPWMAPLCNVQGSKMILAMGYELERLRVVETAVLAFNAACESEGAYLADKSSDEGWFATEQAVKALWDITKPGSQSESEVS